MPDKDIDNRFKKTNAMVDFMFALGGWAFKLWAVWTVLGLGLVATLAYVVIHFLAKYW